jgi:hypothetical protein
MMDASPLEDSSKPSITNNLEEFAACCEKLLSLGSFFNCVVDDCPNVIPKKEDGSLDVDSVFVRMKEAAEALKATVNRGEGTSSWRVPMFIGALHLLPSCAGRLGATGRMRAVLQKEG